MSNSGTSPRPASPAGPIARTVGRMPPTSFFLTSAVFHYLGPSLAVLLFAHTAVLGVAWLRITSAAVVFALWRRPWHILTAANRSRRRVFLALGAVLVAMNSMFYLAVDRLPLSTVGAIEFLGTVILAAAGARTRRNVLALVLAAGGVCVLTAVRLSGQPLGFAFAFANCIGFMLYVILGHRIANTAADGSDSSASSMSGIDQLGLSMLVAAIVATPFGIVPAVLCFAHPVWLLWGIGVGLCSSVIPYVTDQLAMARLPRATFALMLTLLPATATIIGLIVLHQVPTLQDIAGIGLVILGVAIHHDPSERPMYPSLRSSRLNGAETCLARLDPPASVPIPALQPHRDGEQALTCDRRAPRCWTARDIGTATRGAEREPELMICVRRPRSRAGSQPLRFGREYVERCFSRNALRVALGA